MRDKIVDSSCRHAQVHLPHVMVWLLRIYSHINLGYALIKFHNELFYSHNVMNVSIFSVKMALTGVKYGYKYYQFAVGLCLTQYTLIELPIS